MILFQSVRAISNSLTDGREERAEESHDMSRAKKSRKENEKKD